MHRHNASAINLRDALVRDWERERSIAAVLNRCAIVVSLGSLATLIALLFAGGYDHAGLVALSVYSVFTRLGSVVVHRVFLYPRLLAELASADPRRREAARAVADRHRDRLLRDIALNRFLKPDAAALAHLDWDEIAAWPQVREIDRWRRIGWICLGLWALATAALYLVLAFILQ